MKKIYILPNLLTTANMFCGFYSIVSALNGDFLTAAWAILIAMAFDLMDGRVARLTRTTSTFGVEYDSFSDLISFGLAPSLVTYLWCLKPYGRLGWLAAFLYTACTALRLARFNILVNVVSKRWFQGLPSPLAAATIATAIVFYHEVNPPVSKETYMLVLLFVLASLMISTLRFFSFKDFHVDRENSFRVLAVGILILILIAVKPEVTIFLMASGYIGISVLLNLYRIAFRRGETSPAPNETKTL